VVVRWEGRKRGGGSRAVWAALTMTLHVAGLLSSDRTRTSNNIKGSGPMQVC